MASARSVVRARRWWISLLPVLAVTVALSAGYLWNEDFWWYRSTGHAILDEGGVIPDVDPYLYTSDAEDGWVYHSWLWTVLVAACDRVAGLEGVVWFHAALASLLIGLLYTAARVDALGVANALMAAIFIIERGPRLTGKTEVATWLLLVVFYRVLERDGRFGWRKMTALAVLQVLWANLHGGFPLGIALVLCYSVVPWGVERFGGRLGDRFEVPAKGERPPLWFPLLLFAVSVADPRFPGERLAPFGFVFGSESVQPIGAAGTMLIKEWRSPFDPSISSPRILLLFLGPLAIAAATFLLRRRASAPRLALLLGMGGLGVMALRNVGASTLVAGLVTLSNLSVAVAARRVAAEPKAAGRYAGKDRTRRRSWRLPRHAYPVAAGVLAVVLCSTAVALWLARPGFEGGQSAAEPFNVKPPLTAPAAARFIEEHGLQGPIFNDYQLGAYLGPRLYPDLQAFIDPRVLDPALVVRYTRMVGSADEWRRAEGDFGFRTAVLSHFSRTLSSPLGATLRADPRWRLVFVDPLAAVFVKDQLTVPVESVRWLEQEPGTGASGTEPAVPYQAPAALVGPLAKLAELVLHDTPANYQVEYLASLGRLGRTRAVEEIADRVLELSPDSALVLRQRCAARMSRGALDAARADCRRSYELRPGDPQVVALYAMVLARGGEVSQARWMVEEALEDAPSDPTLRRLRDGLPRGPGLR